MLAILPALALAASTGNSSVKPAERLKTMKAMAKSVAGKTVSGGITFGQPRIEADTVVLPITSATTESIDQIKAATALDLFAAGVCDIRVVEILGRNQFSIKFEFSKDGQLIASKSVSPDLCASLWAKKVGFGNSEKPPIIGAFVNRPVFTFKNLVATSNLGSEALSECQSIHVKENGVVDCTVGPIDVSGQNVYQTVDFYKGRLSTLVLSMNYGADKSYVLDAFVRKYGKPQESEVETWQNKLGAKFDNPTFTWYFRSGYLTFKTMANEMNVSKIYYIDVNRPAEAKPEVNF